uniref:EF-hand domain-containing protein n=1 Tax=Lotharella globosa TaxID=91324 RepID=A0A7S3YNB9_9EUKA|mmetsp:Transcript_17736/g.35770  ORF Transcript_17736/g.35770 Transcript_17736/m.35770 type:complete len:681 (+) Transcript_17736:79-2121(+)
MSSPQHLIRRSSTFEVASQTLAKRANTLEERKKNRTKWCKVIFDEVDEDGDKSVTRKEFMRFLRAVHLQPRMYELSSNHGYLSRWFAKLLLGNVSAYSQQTEDKAINKLMGLLKKHDVGTEKLNTSDLTHMWHDLMHRVYCKVCNELKVGQLYMLDIVYLRCCIKWGGVEVDLMQEILRDENLAQPISSMEFAHLLGHITRHSLLNETRYSLSKILRFIGVSLTDSTLLAHIHMDIRRYLLSLAKEPGKRPEGDHYQLAVQQWGKDRKVSEKPPPKYKGVSHDTEMKSEEYIKVLLEKLDDNDDGYLSFREFLGFLQKLPMQLLSSELYTHIFNDALDDGEALDISEFVHFMEKILGEAHTTLCEGGVLTLEMLYKAQRLLTGQHVGNKEMNVINSALDLTHDHLISKEQFIDFILLAFVKAIQLERGVALPHFFSMVILVTKEASVRKAMYRQVMAAAAIRRYKSIRTQRTKSIAVRADVRWSKSAHTLDVHKFRSSAKLSYLPVSELIRLSIFCGLEKEVASARVAEYAPVVKIDPMANLNVNDFLDEYVRMSLHGMVVVVLEKGKDRRVAFSQDNLLEVMASYIGMTEAKKHVKVLFRNISTRNRPTLDTKEFEAWHAEKEKQMVAFRQVRARTRRVFGKQPPAADKTPQPYSRSTKNKELDAIRRRMGRWDRIERG